MSAKKKKTLLSSNGDGNCQGLKKGVQSRLISQNISKGGGGVVTGEAMV